jgi:predicted AAA+ superfamily ATPase
MHREHIITHEIKRGSHKVWGYYMQRMLEYTLIDWKDSLSRSPLLIRGARQVGKTFLINKFAKENFASVVTLNFDLQPEYKQCFETLQPIEINNLITVISRQAIIPGETLLFLDEIQECPNAIMALRYYKELMPELHVIAAGSLLEFVLKYESFSMPVGRVHSLYLKPMTFNEFLLASGYQDLLEQVANAKVSTQFNPAITGLLEKLLHIYFITGGMPEVIQSYLQTQDFSQTKIIQLSLLNTFRNDFGKYATIAKHKYLQRLFEKAPGLIAAHFKYSQIDPEMQARDLKMAIETLQYAGLIHQVWASSATGLPLNALVNPKRYKLLFLDIGLVKASSNLDAELMLHKDLMLVNKGNLAEQFVGQELLALAPPYSAGELCYWERDVKGSSAEVDYVINVGEKIIPIEVKSGKTGTLKSMNYFLQNVVKDKPLGIKISMQPLGLRDNILSVPLYMLSDLERLVKEII